MGDLSAHFSRGEFRDHSDGSLKGPATALVAVLERIRALSGRPLVIVSGYRSPKHNRAVGGAGRSRHLQGDAADIPPGVCTAQQAIACGATGVGVCNGWAVHIDTRPVARPVIFADC